MPDTSPKSCLSPMAVDKIDAVTAKALGAFQRGAYDDAIQLYTDAIAADPTNVSLYSSRSLAFLSKRQFVFALRDANKCIELDPSFSRGYFQKGQAYENLLQYNAAIAAYDAGLQANPTDVDITRAKAALLELDDVLNFSSVQPAPENDKFARLIQWLKEGGAKLPKLHLKYYTEDYRGVHALGTIHTDEVVLFVPHKLIMTSEVARASPIGQAITRANVELRSKHSYLAMYLLEERSKGDRSVWAPYINTLPTKFANVPLFFDEDALAWLHGSYTLHKIADRLESLVAEYDTLCRAVPACRKYSYAEFVWARLAVITRIFGLQVGSVKTDGLVPFADMLNHKLPRETRWCYDDPVGGFVITALQDLPRGCPVHDSYGRKCNNRFFVNYGFVLDDNPDNEAVLRLAVPMDDAGAHALKLRVLGGREGSLKREYQVPADYREIKCRELLSFARFAVMDAREVQIATAISAFDPNDVEPVSVANELRALALVRAAAEEALSQFPNTLEEDEALLAEGSLELYSNERNCVVMRLGEKRVLRWYAQLAALGEELLHLPLAEVRKWLAAHPQHSHESYISRVVCGALKDRR